MPTPLINNTAISAPIASNIRSTGFGTTLSFQLNLTLELVKYL
jgi:hypothetical protein